MAREDVNAQLTKDFVVLKIDQDRTIGSEDIKQRFPASVESGIPWFAILEPSGAAVVTSSFTGQNIGCPWTDEEIANFGRMLATGCKRLGEAERDKLLDSLRAYKREIEEDRKRKAERKAKADG